MIDNFKRIPVIISICLFMVSILIISWKGKTVSESIAMTAPASPPVYVVFSEKSTESKTLAKDLSDWLSTGLGKNKKIKFINYGASSTEFSVFVVAE